MLATRTVASAAFNTALTKAEWQSDSASAAGTPSYHAVFEFTDTEMNISMTGAVNNEKEFGLVVSALGAAGRVSLGRGTIVFVQDGATGTGTSNPPVATRTMTDEEIIAGDASAVKLGENPAGAAFILKSAAGKGIRVWAADEPDGSVTFRAEQIT